MVAREELRSNCLNWKGAVRKRRCYYCRLAVGCYGWGCIQLCYWIGRLLVAADVNATCLSLDILPDLRHDDERVKDLVWELIIFGERRYVGSNIQLEVVNRWRISESLCDVCVRMVINSGYAIQTLLIIRLEFVSMALSYLSLSGWWCQLLSSCKGVPWLIVNCDGTRLYLCLLVEINFLRCFLLMHIYYSVSSGYN